MESLIVFLVMTGLLLPARLLFVEYVSDDWLGSFGIISAISLAVIILVKKQKLGAFGRMFERQLYKFQKGKRGILVFGESIFLLLILGGMIITIDLGNSVYSDLKTPSSTGSYSNQQILDSANSWSADDWLNAFVKVPSAFLTAFPQMSATIASIDERLDGWLLHFYTVGLVEYIELLGVLIFYRISFLRKSRPGIDSIIHRTSV